MDRLIVRGAREHNLKDVSLDLPRDALIVFTGLSGSGKSSLAFDTIFAEGQRRYVESLSAYARQFLGQMDKPDVDFIEGLSPAVSIDQKSTSRNPRSTVGTITEVYDYLRLLFARAGRPHCPVCGEPISRQTPQQIVDRVLELDEGTRFQVLAPVVRGRKGEYVELFRELQTKGYSRARVDGATVSLAEPPKLDKKYKHTIDVVVDRLSVKPSRQAAAHRLGRDRARAGRRPGHPRLRRPAGEGHGPRAAVLRAARLPQRPPAVDRRARAAVVLVQLAVRRLPRVHRPRHPARGRPRADRPRRREVAGRGRGRAVGGRRVVQRVLPAAARGARRRPEASAWTRRGASCPARRARRRPARPRLPGARQVPEPLRPDALLLHRLRGRDPVRAAPAHPRPSPTGAGSATRATCARCPARPATGSRLKPESLAVPARRPVDRRRLPAADPRVRRRSCATSSSPTASGRSPSG